MNTVMVWVLLTVSNNYAGLIVYSPPMPSAQECQRVRAVLKDTTETHFSARCIQMTIAK